MRILCGSVPADLETFSRISQISQAEAKKFFVERTRIKKWRRTGIIWWNMLDGWPQISDAIVDYYFNKKLAYTWLKRVHEPVCLMLDELQDWGRNAVLGNDSRQDKTVEWSVRNGDSGEVLLQGKTLSPANENVVLGNIRELAGAQKFYLLTWTVDGKVVGTYKRLNTKKARKGQQWPFDHPFYIILNQSVGDHTWIPTMSKAPRLDATYETEFDWVRVYALKK